MSRVDRLRATLEEPLLVSNVVNVHYLVGFSSSNAALLVEPERVQLFSDFRYAEAARAVEEGNGGRDDLFLPESESRYLRLTMIAAGEGGAVAGAEQLRALVADPAQIDHQQDHRDCHREGDPAPNRIASGMAWIRRRFERHGPEYTVVPPRPVPYNPGPWLPQRSRSRRSRSLRPSNAVTRSRPSTWS